ncbi:hypothetical protein [Salirhabdus salicampi]|uniref:hypothetical protein n=1 Tax=Salirhabdus salicampi TaxID=476102 RepID=UPI0020C48CEC|nr:hypothetical protein [Salirhabdus salicampi]MCP8615400.1 hypothetical protein [Salirhabdus salicampi]
MELCHECNSDVIEKQSNIGIKIFACIVLLFIPYGILICWVPFLFPPKYYCKQCGHIMDEPKYVDWREFEKKKAEIKKEE